jgi:predicted acylesterase/phospholipase RssA
MGPDAAIPHGAAANDLPRCDLVMKGGITSGVVYPSMVKVLATRYRFASIGGSSAGAIAAAVCAAAEYGRQEGNKGGIERLDDALRDLEGMDALLGLFQPTPKTRPLFEVLIKAMSANGEVKIPARIRLAARAAAWRRKWLLVACVAVLAGLVRLAYAGLEALSTGDAFLLVVLIVLLAVLVVVLTGVVAMALLVWQAYRSLDASDYGMCPGTRQEGGADPALIDWLHEQIQHCAGREVTDAPLTFRELAKHGIAVTMLTTDLSYARPVRVPTDIGDYAFDPDEVRERFPDPIVAAMEKAAKPSDAQEGYLQMPDMDLPVLVGVRLSLSFPLLMSAMPLHRIDPSTHKLVRHLFSDGRIGSNFPVHFFDAWFPGRPTFGIDLARYPGAAEVFMLADPSQPSIPRWHPVDSLWAFFGEIKDAVQNWRDTLQSELPGFRDRVCQIRFAKGQGGLYLGMDEKVIEDMVRRGKLAGQTILATFDERHWDQHRFVRYLTLMIQVQDNVQGAGPAFGAFAPALEQGLPTVGDYRKGRDAEWCRRARQATAALLLLGNEWGPPPLDLNFHSEEDPTPQPVMRIVPEA